MKFYIWVLFRKSVESIQVSLKSDKNNGYFTWRPIHFLSYLAHLFLEWEMFQTVVVEEIKTHVLYSVTFFRNPCFLWHNVEKHGRARQASGDIIRHMCFACWITKATNTHSEYVILPAFPRQQWLRECALVLSYAFVAYLVYLLCVQW